MRNQFGTKSLIATSFAVLATLILTGATLRAQTRQQPQIKPPSQTGGEPNTTPTVLVSPDEDYRIGPRDVIEVQIEDATELSGTWSVNAEGTFLMHYLGRLKAQGKTTEELSKEIADGLRGRYLKDPRVTVVVRQYYSRSFFILGAVRKPGVYQIEGKPSLLKLITIAGGPAENHGSLAFVIHEIKKNQPASTEGGETIKRVSTAAQPSASQASTDEEEEVDLSIRTVNINGMFKGVGLDKKAYLEPGDIVNIPPADIFFVAGEVNAPGQFTLKEGTTLRQAIALAQGTTFNAKTSEGTIFREDPVTGKRVEIKIDINEVMRGKKEDTIILANDIVVVPNSKGKTIGNAVLKALGMGAAQRGPYRY